MLKKIYAVLICLCTVLTMMAQARTQVSPGIYIAQYGDVYVIENDNTQQTVQIKVVKDNTVYNVFCNNTLVQSVAKAGLKAAIEGAIISVSGVSSGGWVSAAVAGDAANRIYNWACSKLR